MVDEMENQEQAKEDTAQPSAKKSPLDMKLILMGAGVFVIFVIVFLVLGGAFSAPKPSEVAEAPQEQTQTQAQPTEENSGDQGGTAGWNQDYSGLPADEEPLPDSGMSEQDSVKQVLWYVAQKQEIEKAKINLRTEQARLQQLKMETQALIEKKEQIEQTNIANLAQLFETMKSEEVAKIMENIPNEKVGLILQKMKKQNASKVMASLPSERAAKISMELIDLGGDH